MHLSHLVVDDQGDIYLGGSGVTLFRISSALYTLPPNPFDPQGGEDMGGQDLGDALDMGSTGELDLGGELDAGSDLGSAQKDAGSSSPFDDMSAAKQDMASAPDPREPMTRPEATSEGVLHGGRLLVSIPWPRRDAPWPRSRRAGFCRSPSPRSSGRLMRCEA